DPERKLEGTDKLHSLAESGLTASVASLRDVTALHDTVFSGVIKAIARSRADLAAEVAESLNTEPRRDEALACAVTDGFDRGSPPVGFPKARDLIERIRSPQERQEAVFKILETARRRKDVPAAWGGEVRQFFALIQRIADAGVRAGCWVRVYCVLARSDPV